ncbi:hypothetical protein N658DRAFT_507292 [Parathielavia hyrcaniae]|uniref:Uncharacterized protein n=1 Tax=Parathielavia hyrcaniae TaxID=113614 RepID=A0AAN6PZS8_9PEZI|nr:hypothetical protein N658DRAFT_507292 [Parathielavia hyrcaniae]
MTPLPSSGEWEGPHPGERYLINVLGDARSGAAASCCNGVAKVGMAAKAHYSPYPARRLAPPRVRTRTTSPRPHLKVARDNNNTNNKNNNNNKAGKAVRMSARSSAAPVFACWRSQSPETAHPRGQTEDLPNPLSMTDFSGFLKSGVATITTTPHDARSYMSVDATEQPPRLSANDSDDGTDDDPDPYGWDAELDTRVRMDKGLADVLSEVCPVLQHRRTGGAHAGATKSTLLKRVLSLGSGSNGHSPGREG